MVPYCHLYCIAIRDDMQLVVFEVVQRGFATLHNLKQEFERLSPLKLPKLTYDYADDAKLSPHMLLYNRRQKIFTVW